MGFPIAMPIRQGNDHNLIMYNSFELVFFWRKYSTVVAVGVQTSFLPFAKSVTEKKNNKAWIVRKPTKRPCKPRGTRGGDF